MFVKKFLKSIAPAALLASPALAQEAPRPDLDPAVWVVKDADTTIYLFGTVHALDGKGDWLNDEVKDSFDKSSELVMEIITPEDQAALLPLLQKYAMETNGKTLTSRLSAKHQALYAERLTAMGLPVAAFDTFKPFFAAMTLTVLDMQKLGIDPEQGAEKVLTKAAKAKGMKIGEVESIEQQFQMLGSLSEADQVKMLESTLEEQEKSKETITKLIAAWGKGDHETVGTLMNDGEKDSKALYELLLVNRNKTWAEWIDKRLDQPGTVFMAVGAGHLAGPDSVQKHLKDRGIKTDRVHPAHH